MKKKSIRVPEDVQIIGYDGIRDYYSGRYHCSTIVQPIREIAQTCVELILQKNRASLPSLWRVGGVRHAADGVDLVAQLTLLRREIGDCLRLRPLQ